MTITTTPVPIDHGSAEVERAVRTLEVPAVNLAGIAADERTVAVLRAMADAARRALRLQDGRPNLEFFRSDFGRYISGVPIERAAIDAAMGSERVDVLIRSGAAIAIEELLSPAIAFGWAYSVPVVIPVHQPDAVDRVYIGCETPWLTKLAFRHGPGSGRAAELAAGTGAVAVALTAQYAHVTAADLLPGAVDCAALTLAINNTDRSQTRAIVADVAGGLEQDSFDLVVGNPPWVPTQRTTLNYVYADGGRTGMELPSRFIAETTRLLRPGGIGIMIVCDTAWSDGSRPLQRETEQLKDMGYAVTIESAPRSVWGPEDEVEMVADVDGLVAAEVQALVFAAPS